LLLPRDADGVRRLLALAYYDPPWVPDFVARQVVSQFYEPHRAEHMQLLDAVEANTAEHRTQYVLPPAQPTLIVWGRADRVFPEKAARRLRAELGDRSQLCVFEKAAHAPHLERGRDVTPLIHEFLTGTQTGCPPGSKQGGHDDV
jgi:pimeloyl-ACP methyl ester carboxylesterase